MTDGFEYDEAAVAREEANYRTPTANARRAFVRERLAPDPEESVLSVGCGPGFEPAEIVSTDRAGRVAGVDSNPMMLARARKRCSNDVSLLQGDATNLPVAEDAFDTALSVQVYEYVDDLTAALAELYRVLGADGRAVVYATDWDSLVWHAGNRERAARVLDAWNDHCARPRLGSELSPALRSASFEAVDVTAYPIVLTELGRDSYAHYLLESIREFVVAEVGEETARAWADDLRALDRRGETFFSLCQFCYLVEPT
jgi:ubiquinone/menaquinone biosynthesis C-methylase UbiE